jgi:hypothetical protein
VVGHPPVEFDAQDDAVDMPLLESTLVKLEWHAGGEQRPSTIVRFRRRFNDGASEDEGAQVFARKEQEQASVRVLHHDANSLATFLYDR